MKEKENLIEKIGMKFDEAVELFSEETLLSMSMVNIVGGTNKYCDNAQCNDGCQGDCKCGTSSSGSILDTIGKVATTVATVITAVATLVAASKK